MSVLAHKCLANFRREVSTKLPSFSQLPDDGASPQDLAGRGGLPTGNVNAHSSIACVHFRRAFVKLRSPNGLGKRAWRHTDDISSMHTRARET